MIEKIKLFNIHYFIGENLYLDFGREDVFLRNKEDSEFNFDTCHLNIINSKCLIIFMQQNGKLKIEQGEHVII